MARDGGTAGSLISPGRFTRDGEAAGTCLRDRDLLPSFTRCPRCGRTRPGRIRRQGHRCYRCRGEGGVRKGRIFERSQVPFSTLSLAINLFEPDPSVREAARQPGRACPTACRLHHLCRTAIQCTAEDTDSLKRETELDESDFRGRRNGKRGRGAAGRGPVFGVLERECTGWGRAERETRDAPRTHQQDGETRQPGVHRSVTKPYLPGLLWLSSQTNP